MPAVSVSVQSITQYTAGVASTISGGGKVGSSHTGSEFSPATAYTMELRYAIKFAASAEKLTFNLAYALAMNSATIVSGQAFRYGIGTSSAVPSSYNVFTWDTTNKQAENLTVYGNFAADTTYYLWVFYDWHNQNNCYVSGVDISSISGDTDGEAAPSATITANKAIGYISSSNNWDADFSNVGTNKWLVTEIITKSRLIGIRFKTDKPLSKLDMSIDFTSVSGTDIKYRVNQSTSPHQEPFLVADTAMTLSDKTATATINYNFAADTDYTIWIYGTTESQNPTFTFAPTPVTYTVTLPSGTGFICNAVDGSSNPVLTGGSFSFSVTLLDGYTQGSGFSVKVDGVAISPSDGKYTISNITADKTVTVEGVELGGIVYIANGNSFDAYQVFIANGVSWDQYMPYAANGSSWDLQS